MARQPVVTEAEPGCVSADQRVRHYDELDDETQAYIESVARGHATDGGSPDPSLSSGDVVVFTDYYRVV
ncbi:MAG: hypothetical protein ABEH47_04060 [Haloferacaceae archaeon]